MPDAAFPRILGVGIACLDYLFMAPRAEPGGQARLAGHAIQGGGLVGTALSAAARLGAKAEIWTWVGDDAEGQEVLSGLRQEGVDVSRAERVRGARTPVSFIQVEERTGERTIYHGSRLEPPRAGIEALRNRPLGCDALVVDAVYAAASQIAASRARAAGLPVVGDFYPSRETADLAGDVSALIVSASASDRAIPGATRTEQLRSLAKTGADFIAITCGAEGCHYLDDDFGYQPAFGVEVVDTTGAGDVFHGAFAYALARRWPTVQAVEFASAAAALSCRALGGRAAAPTLEEVAELLREQGSDIWARVSG